MSLRKADPDFFSQTSADEYLTDVAAEQADWTHTGLQLDINDTLSIPLYHSSKKGKRVLCLPCRRSFGKPYNLKRHYSNRHVHDGNDAAAGPGTRSQPHRIGGLAQRLDGHERASALADRRASGTRAPAASLPLPSEATPPFPPEPMDVDAEIPESMASANGSIQWKTSTPQVLAGSGLVVLENFNAILCTECQRCTPFNHALGHLKDAHHFTSLLLDDYNQLVRRLSLAVEPKDIVLKVKAERLFEECPWLAQSDGWWCEVCGYATPSRERAEQHRRNAPHEFPTERVRVNGDVHERRQDVIEGTIQTLFSKNHGGYIPSIPISSEDASISASDIFRQVLALKQDLFEPAIVAQKDPRSVHPFIQISGFGRWLEKMPSWPQVEELQKLMRPNTPPWGKRLVSHCKEMMMHSFDLCVPGTYVPRCHVNSPSAVIESTPFGELTSKEAQDRYCSEWAGIMAYLIQCIDVPDAKRGFRLSETQITQLKTYKTLLVDPNSDENEAITALILVSDKLFCHRFKGDADTDHPLIAYTILRSTQAGHVIANPIHISPRLARIEYFCRVAIMNMADLARKANAEVTFFDAVKDLSPWVKEGENMPFAWLRQMLHLTATFVYGTNQMPRFVWGLDKGGSYTFDGYRIYVKEFISLVQGSVQDAVDSFFNLWSSYGLSDNLLLTSLGDVGDQLASRSTNYNFARHPVNLSVQKKAEDCLNCAVNSNIFCRVKRVNGEDKLVWYPNCIRDRLEMSRNFLRILAVAVYLASGQPPRGTELMATLIANIDTRVRNNFVSNGRMLLCHFLNKTTFLLKSDKAIVRELCLALSLVLANYVALLRPIESKLAPQAGVAEVNVAEMQQRLFQVGSQRLTTDALTTGLKHQWRKAVTRYGDKYQGWGTADTRQNAIYVGKRWVKLDQLGDEGDALFDLQAGHNSATAAKHYGVDVNRLAGDMDLPIMDQFVCVSRAHHAAYTIENILFKRRNAVPLPSEIPHPPPGPITQLESSVESLLSKELLPPSYRTQPPSSGASLASSDSPPTALPAFDEEAFSSRVVSRLENTLVEALEKLAIAAPNALGTIPWSGPIPPPATVLPAGIDPEVYTAMQEIIPGGRFRSPEQARAAQAAWERKNHILAVLPTGGGKTLVAEVTTRLERSAGMLNVILVPLKALAEDLKARFTKARVMVEIWDGSENPPWCQVLIAIFEGAGKKAFINHLRQQIEKKTLGRIIVDECHYSVFSDPAFRKGMLALSELVILGAQLVLLTATAPPASTGKLLEYYGIPSATVIRASTNRPNIRYEVIQMPPKPQGMEPPEFAYNVIKQALKNAGPGTRTTKYRVLIYMTAKNLIDAVWKLAQADPEMAKAPWVRYHADMATLEKQQALEAWVSVNLASSAFGVGVNPGDCGLVLHYEPPNSMLDYVQESGRAGRDGEPSNAVLLWQRTPQRHEGQEPGQAIMASYIETTLCYRRLIFGYMDGTAADCFSLSKDNRFCGNCVRAYRASQGAQTTLPKPHEVGPLISRTAIAASASSFTGLCDRIVPWAKQMRPDPIPKNQKCAKCYLEGRKLGAHWYGMWNCNSRFDRSTMDRYTKEWKPTWHKVATAEYSVHMCSLCWLPTDGDAYHDRSQRLACRYVDVFGHLAYAVWHDKEVMEEFKRDNPDVQADSLVDWGEWISSPNALRAPRFWDLVIWTDRRNASFQGRVMLIN